jgi:monovalent cation:H+ antiporter-2, CPA2 family
MPEHTHVPYLKEVILFLTLSGILIPLLQKYRFSQMLGLLAVGAVFGPYGLGLLAQDFPWLNYLSFPRLEGVRVLADLGVVFLLFMIGLELSTERLWAMRRWVFGAGLLQVLVSTMLIGEIAYAFGNRWEAALILGLALSLSSTAVVMQLLIERKEIGSPLGRASFAILLFQDLVVVPLLILINILGRNRTGASQHC